MADVLGNIPSITVDVEGNIALRGNNNVRILINGKPSGLVGISGPDGLRQLPSESIEKVEVITSPSARYDAEGTGGILNIILKKQERSGFNGNFNINGGIPETFRGTATVNWKTKKLNLFSTNTIGRRTSISNGLSENEYFNEEEANSYLFETGKINRERDQLFISLGAEYFIDKSSSFTLNGFYRDNEGINDGVVTIDELNSLDGSTISTVERKQYEPELDESFQLSGLYEKKFNDKGHEISATYQYEQSTEDELAQITSLQTFPSIRINDNEEVTTLESQKRILAQVDYIYPLDENTQIELGYRGTFNTIETDYEVAFIENNNRSIDADLTNVLVYKEYVNAAYSQFGKKINKFSLLLGLRMEDSNIVIDQRTTNDYTNKRYTNWFPTVNLSFEIDQKESITLGYAKRIRRPRGFFLNPFPSRNSITNFFQGNPDLDPASTGSFDLGYLKRFKKFTINGSIYYQRTTNNFQFVNEDTGETVILSGDPNDPISDLVIVPVLRRGPINLSKNKRYGGEANLTFTPNRKIRLNANFNVYSNEVIGTYNGFVFDAKNVSWSSRFISSINFGKGLSWQNQLFFRGPRVTAQSKSKPLGGLSTAINKDILKEKGTLSFRISDVFNSQKYRSNTFTDTFNSYTEFQWRQPTYIVTLTYRLNQKKNQRNRRSGYRGDDDGGYGY
ncbi:MAG: TonB-dependent receptor [Bacteroidota bacterium]|nr:TonB-dependent receptor [Bacteroidota bacterium]